MDKLVYIARSRIPSERANCIQVLKMCAGFAAYADVRLIAPYYWEDARQRDALWDQFALARKFALTWLPFPHAGERFAVRGFALAVAAYVRWERYSIAYTRDPLVAYNLARAGVRVGFEAHHLEEDRRYPIWQKLVGGTGNQPGLRGIFCISKSLMEDYQAAGVGKELLHWAPDGVDLQRFEHPVECKEARLRLRLPAEGRIVCHCGHLYPGRGAEETVEALRELPDVLLVMVGGIPADIARVRAFAAERGLDRRVRWEGVVPNGRIPLYLWAADALVMPYTTRTFTHRAMSPLKMFEYMAAQRPIVATDFPSIREVLRDGENALIVAPDSARSIADGLRRVLDDPDLAERLAHQARRDVESYNWERRAATILDILVKP
jgi:glycosyltransferase involved in cell wall biosynthesis